ncbi:hypothetical protein LP7551_04614 [Roseibium album]|nr:hypothetical protein LP7551_04614 [Roseibium album]
MVDEETIRTYDAKAGDYAKRFARDEPSGYLKSFVMLVKQGGRELDWGCGPAAASFHLQETGFTPDPIDASPEMVALANERFGLKAMLGTFILILSRKA